MAEKQTTLLAILALPYELSDLGIIYGAPKADDSSTFIADLELEEISEQQAIAERTRGEFIVKACNAHYELLEALKELVAFVPDYLLHANKQPDVDFDVDAELHRARFAIARATGDAS